jgi:hypothetical protein
VEGKVVVDTGKEEMMYVEQWKWNAYPSRPDQLQEGGVLTRDVALL